jgi:hypothetical protein
MYRVPSNTPYKSSLAHAACKTRHKCAHICVDFGKQSAKKPSAVSKKEADACISKRVKPLDVRCIFQGFGQGFAVSFNKSYEICPKTHVRICMSNGTYV